MSRSVPLYLATLATVALVFCSAKTVQPAKSLATLLDRLHPRTDPQVPRNYVSRSETSRFRTRVDHFNVQNLATFEFNYLSNDEFYKPGGPIFIVVGGNLALNGYNIENGLFHEIASREGAWLFTNEHRYYGSSSPVEDYSAPNLRFLSVEQTLIDLIEWIYYLRNEVVRDPNAKVILHGSGYAGTVAIWARQRFPNLVDGAWGSAATVIAQVNFSQYGQDMGNTIRTLGGDECYDVIWRGFRGLESLLDGGRYARVSELFRSCEPLQASDPLSVETFFYDIKALFEAELFSQATYESVTNMCAELLANPADSPVEVLANFVGRWYAGYDCVPFDFESNIAGSLNEEVDFPLNAEFGIRQRLYQLCTEFGWFLMSASYDSPFGTSLTYRYFVDTCRTAFGDWLTQEVVYEGVRLTNLHYGADDPRVTNVVYVNAEFDPMRLVSITNYSNIQANAFVIDRAVVAMDWMTPNENDPEALKVIQREIESYIHLWVHSGLN